VTRVLLVGRWPDPGRRRTGFPELRTEGIARVLEASGCALRVAGLVPAGRPTDRAAGDPATLQRVEEEGAGWLDAIAAHGADADVVVGAGPYNAPRAACLVAGERPVWADVPGDPFAEVQAWALAEGSDPAARQAAAQAAALPVLARADAFGVVSERQRLLLLGQLGLLGRLPVDRGDAPVSVVPVAWPEARPLSPPRTRPPGSPLTLLLAGSFNTWLDVETLMVAFSAARQRRPLRMLVSGGPIPGHHDATWDRFRAWADTQGDAVSLLGQLPAVDLDDALATADAGVCLDRPGLEPETGSRTRVLFYLQRGLEVVATTRSELTATLAARGLLHAVPPGDADALAHALVGVVDAGRSPDDAAATSPALRELAATLDERRVYAPIVDFVATPRRHPSVDTPMAALADAHARLLDEQRRLHGSPTWRLLNRLHRVVGKG